MPKYIEPWEIIERTMGYEIVISFGVGAKCVIAYLPGENSSGDWIAAGAPCSAGRPRDPATGRKENHARAYGDLPMAGGLDGRQARVYYQCGRTQQQDAKIVVVLPEDAPFRACRKGIRQDRTRSFDEEGNPVLQVRLLHALKTGTNMDIRKAFNLVPPEVFRDVSESPSFSGLIVSDMEDINWTKLLREFLGAMMTQSASEENGFADWALWEKVADDAAKFTRRRREIAAGHHNMDGNGLFLAAVEQSARETRGLPVKMSVQKILNDLRKSWDWREIRKTLGFEWLPSAADWNKFRRDYEVTNLWDWLTGPAAEQCYFARHRSVP